MSLEELNKLERKYKTLGKALTKKNRKWKKFADNFIESGNAADAYVKADYNPRDKASARKSANKLRTNADIKSYIGAKTRYLQAKDEDKKIAKASEVLELFTRIIRGEETEEVPMATAKEVITIDKTPSIKEKISAGKELLKRYPDIYPAEKQRLRKLIAETDISEAQAKAMQDDNNDSQVIIVDDIKEVMKREENRDVSTDQRD